jgi:hypothetical protein
MSGGEYYIFGRRGNYGGGYGAAKKESIYDLAADRIDQQIFPFDMQHFAEANNLATEYLTLRQLDGSMARDLAMDHKNPRQELPKNKSDLRNIEEIRWAPDAMIVSSPMDYKAHDQVQLMHDANQNYMTQEGLFTDPKLSGEADSLSDHSAVSTRGEGLDQAYTFGGSAAGKINDRLYDEPSGTRYNNLVTDSAF